MEFGRWLSISIGILFFIQFCFAEKAPYSFTKEAASAAPVTEYYDYIVVGGGAAGCALAATLSSSAKVLLIERGGSPYNNPHVTNKNGFISVLLELSPSSPAQLFVSEDGVFSHRGRILGGGTAINAGFYTRSEIEYVQQAGWDPLLVNESYEWVERKIVFEPRIQQWQSAVRNGLLEAGVLPYRGFSYEHLIGTKIGGVTFDKNGYRHTAADLLEYANSTNIIVYLHSTVQKILIHTTGQRPKAYGVEFKDSKGVMHMAYLNDGQSNEIILSAGALGSPQLLMLSGIGPVEQLRANGVKVIVDQPLVGQGMADNPLNVVLFPSTKPVETSLAEVVGISDVGSYSEALSGFVNLSWAREIAQNYAKTVNKKLPIFTIPTSILGNIFSKLLPNSNIQAGVVGEKIKGPFSTGHLELQSRDPNNNPKITFNYFQDPRDLERCVQGMEIIRKVVESNALSSFRHPLTRFESFAGLTLAIPNNLRGRHLSSVFSLEHYCKDNVMSIWHYHGGCHVDKVVDHDYKVIGVDALRVVDGSVFNSSPGTNPQATVMMLGRYMGQKILRERRNN